MYAWKRTYFITEYDLLPKSECPQAKLPYIAMDNIGMTAPTTRAEQARNPLHGVTLEAIVRALEAHYGWEELARKIPIRCFSHDPSVSSSLKFLRKTPWAREKVESLYLFVLRQLPVTGEPHLGAC